MSHKCFRLSSSSCCSLVYLLFSLITFLNAQGQDAELLYGITNGTVSGPPNGYGHVFNFNPVTRATTSLHSFTGADGSSLSAGLTFLSDGFLYGTTRYGGIYNQGTIFRIKTNGDGFQKLHDFNGIEGSDPTGGLVSYCDGFLYGSTIEGGIYGLGVFYKIGNDGNGFQKLIDFDQINSGFSPRAKPTLIGDKFYLTNAQGGIYDAGTILKILPDGSYSKIIDFDGPDKGGFPNAALILGSNNKLYGVAASGGANNLGTIFELSTDGSGFTKLFDFSLSMGASPLATLFESSSGSLFGTTFGGGGPNVYYGVLFKIDLNGSNFINLHNFGEQDDGSFPDGGLIESNGKLYGITLLGGVNQLGTIYSIEPDGSSYQKIYDFSPEISGQPRCYLSLAKNSGPANCYFESITVCDETSVSLSTTGDTVNKVFQWNTGESSQTITVTTSGNYTVSVFDGSNLIASYLFSVALKNSPQTIFLGNDEILCSHPTRKLQLLTNPSEYIFTWQDSSHNSYFNVSDFGKYWVRIENSCGVVSDTIQFSKYEVDKIIIPNVITPNEDDLNQNFILDNSLIGSEVIIYNRWGSKVYAESNYRNEWDGEGLSSGVYFYFIRDKCGDVFKGSISILR